MRPTPIADDQILDGHTRIVMGPPEGTPDGEVAAVDMLRDLQAPIYRARVELDPGDLERLAAGEPFWLSFWGHVVPFDVALGGDIAAPPDLVISVPAGEERAAHHDAAAETGPMAVTDRPPTRTVTAITGPPLARVLWLLRKVFPTDAARHNFLASALRQLGVTDATTTTAYGRLHDLGPVDLDALIEKIETYGTATRRLGEPEKTP